MTSISILAPAIENQVNDFVERSAALAAQLNIEAAIEKPVYVKMTDPLYSLRLLVSATDFILAALAAQQARIEALEDKPKAKK